MRLSNKLLLAGISSLTLSGGMIAYLEGAGPTRMVGKEKHCVAYLDIAKVWTIGGGLTRVNGQPVTPGMTMPEAECRRLEAAEHLRTENHVRNRLKREPSVAQLSAMTSFTYNVGFSGFDNSSVLRLFNAGDDYGSCQAMMKWVCITVPAGKGDPSGICKSKFTNKQFSKGLQNRRSFERDTCLDEPSIWQKVKSWLSS